MSVPITVIYLRVFGGIPGITYRPGLARADRQRVESGSRLRRAADAHARVCASGPARRRLRRAHGEPAPADVHREPDVLADGDAQLHAACIRHGASGWQAPGAE